MINNTNQTVIIILQIIASFALLIGFLLELFFKFKVCDLCIIQRILWLCLIIVSLVFRNKGIILLVIFGSILVAAYQIMLQFGIMQEVCSIDFRGNDNSCSSRDNDILGFPLAFYNFVVNIIVFVAVSKVMKIREKDNDIIISED